MSDYSRLPCPPFVAVEGIGNFRDAGGYALADSTTASVRRGFLYRCGDPSLVTPAGLAAMRAARITTVFDMRSQPEIDRSAVPQPFAAHDDIQHVDAAAFRAEDYSPDAIAERYRDYATGTVEGFRRAYAQVLRNAGPAIRKILLHIRDQPAQPLLVHCSAGKDRTGLAVALALKLAGASDEVVADEYALTELSLAEQHARAEAAQAAGGDGAAASDAFRKRLLEGAGLTGKEAQRAGGRLMARKEFMLSTLAYMRDTYQGPEGYVRDQCGLSDSDMATIRRNLRDEGVAPML